ASRGRRGTCSQRASGSFLRASRRTAMAKLLMVADFYAAATSHLAVAQVVPSPRRLIPPRRWGQARSSSPLDPPAVLLGSGRTLLSRVVRSSHRREPTAAFQARRERRAEMKSFIVIYSGPPTPPDASHEGWQEWFQGLGDRLVDLGSPMLNGFVAQADA